MKKLDGIILAAILLVGLIFRLYKINAPLADYHSWRQADTAAVARNFAREGIDFLRPTYDDLSSLQTGYENPEGLRYVEFPIYNAMISGIYSVIPFAPIEVYGRIMSILFSLLTISIVYYLLKVEFSRASAVAAATFYAIDPFIIFFSRTVLPETTAVGFMFLSIFLLFLSFRWKSPSSSIVFLTLSIVSYAASLLIKPTTIFYSLVIAFLFIREHKFDVFKNPRPYLFVLFGLLPLVVWRLYIQNFPEGIPANRWLLTHVNTYEGLQPIFFTPAFFRWIFVERVGTMMLGIYGTIFFILGILRKKTHPLSLVALLCAFVYIFTFQGGNVQHEYYQIVIFPAVAMIVGLGFDYLLKNKTRYNQLLLYPTVVIIVGVSWLASYYKVKDFYNVPNDLTQIAKLIQTFTEEDDLIVTDRSGDTTLLYLADRKGAPAVYRNLNELRDFGYKYLVTANDDLKEELRSQEYNFLVENEQFSIIRL